MVFVNLTCCFCFKLGLMILLVLVCGLTCLLSWVCYLVCSVCFGLWGFLFDLLWLRCCMLIYCWFSGGLCEFGWVALHWFGLLLFWFDKLSLLVVCLIVIYVLGYWKLFGFARLVFSLDIGLFIVCLDWGDFGVDWLLCFCLD